MKILILVLFLTSASYSFAAGGSSGFDVELDGVAGVSLANQTSDVPGSKLKANNLTSYGILANAAIVAPYIKIQTGLLYAEAGAHTEIGTSKKDERLPYYQLPVLLVFSSRFISFGAGGYYAIAAGNVEDKNATGTYVNQSVSFSQAGYITNDYGLAGTLRVKLAIGARTIVSINGIYEQGLQNISNSTSNVKNNTVLILAGVGLTY
jgi:hypothetical protein